MSEPGGKDSMWPTTTLGAITSACANPRAKAGNYAEQIIGCAFAGQESRHMIGIARRSA
jgi:hypothetical protein